MVEDDPEYIVLKAPLKDENEFNQLVNKVKKTLQTSEFVCIKLDSDEDSLNVKKFFWDNKYEVDIIYEDYQSLTILPRKND